MLLNINAYSLPGVEGVTIAYHTVGCYLFRLSKHIRRHISTCMHLEIEKVIPACYKGMAVNLINLGFLKQL